MKLAIMQPYFFPYLGYFDLINRVDRWIVFDAPQYIRHGWVNRNRILHPTSGWQYIIVPLKKHHRDTPIYEIQSNSTQDWPGKITKQLGHYKNKAPFYHETIDLVKRCLACEEQSLSRLNTMILREICDVLEIPFDFEYYSEMSLDLGMIQGPGDWALQISRTLNVREYVNAPGGDQLFDHRRFEEEGIKLSIQRYESFRYKTDPYEYIPDLSIIDVLMWNSPPSVHAYLAGVKQKELHTDGS
ncbi:WbqC family protein [Candidatus Neomarinimicrobiota bacterium]